MSGALLHAFVLIIPGTVGSLKDKMDERVGIAVTFHHLFGWYSVRISIGPLDILIKVFRDFPHSLQNNTVMA
jgi:hypothetical protein